MTVFTDSHAASAGTLPALIPVPMSVQGAAGAFLLSAATRICVMPGSAELLALGRALASWLQPVIGVALAVQLTDDPAPTGAICLTTVGADVALGEEGYELSVAPNAVTLRAVQGAGMCHGLQTLRQLLPPAAQERAAIPACVIRDRPRFAWRGMMLDVARHFFGVADVKRLIDLLALYKLNRLHLHLTDDQGWRIAIRSWPRLTEHGGSTAVGGGRGGFYTQAEYAEIVAYAGSRYIVVVPEIDTPGHIQAALASYPELGCDGAPQALYTGMEVGFSTLCIGKELIYRFLDDVIGEIAALTPGPYLHIGGDEAHSTPTADYVAFIRRVQPIVAAHGKQMVGWEEFVQAGALAGTMAQFWHGKMAAAVAAQGVPVIMSPANRAYLDMQYTPETPLGLHWAGYVEVRDAYDWDPAAQVAGVGEAQIWGVEAPLWSETVQTLADVEYLTFPRLLGIAEIGWSPVAGRGWDEYRLRLAAHGPRLAALGVNFYRSPQVAWE